MDRMWVCGIRLTNAHVLIKAVYNAVKHEIIKRKDLSYSIYTFKYFAYTENFTNNQYCEHRRY